MISIIDDETIPKMHKKVRSLLSKLAFGEPTWTASVGSTAVTAGPQNLGKPVESRSPRSRYPWIVRGSRWP
jgi:hypothetical protein